MPPPTSTHQHPPAPTHLEVVEAEHPLAAWRHSSRLLVEGLVVVSTQQAAEPRNHAARAGLPALHLRSSSGDDVCQL